MLITSCNTREKQNTCVFLQQRDWSKPFVDLIKTRFWKKLIEFDATVWNRDAFNSFHVELNASGGIRFVQSDGFYSLRRREIELNSTRLKVGFIQSPYDEFNLDLVFFTTDNWIRRDVIRQYEVGLILASRFRSIWKRILIYYSCTFHFSKRME